MDIPSLLSLGFLIGIRHALEVDHLAAVASISSHDSSNKSVLTHGFVWGIGHTSTLLLFGSIVILMDTVIPEQLAHTLESFVGIMLIVLGLDVLRRVIKERIHYHFHRHQNDLPHIHAHSHSGELGQHNKMNHDHGHRPFPYRTLFIGFMHGMAGSAALILLTLETIDSTSLRVIYMLLFGVGSIVGMTVISMLIAVPLKASSHLTWLHNGLQTFIGLFTIGFGLTII